MSWTPIWTILSRLVKPILMPTCRSPRAIPAPEALLLDRVGVGERDRLAQLRNFLGITRGVVDALRKCLDVRHDVFSAVLSARTPRAPYPSR